MKYTIDNIPHYIGIWNNTYPKYYTHYSKLYNTWNIYCTINNQRPLIDASEADILQFLNNELLEIINLDQK